MANQLTAPDQSESAVDNELKLERQKLTILAIFGFGCPVTAGLVLDAWGSNALARILSTLFLMVAAAVLAMAIQDFRRTRMQRELEQELHAAHAELTELRAQVEALQSTSEQQLETLERIESAVDTIEDKVRQSEDIGAALVQRGISRMAVYRYAGTLGGLATIVSLIIEFFLP